MQGYMSYFLAATLSLGYCTAEDVESCRQQLVNQFFSQSVVEKVLIENGISPTDSEEIYRELMSSQVVELKARHMEQKAHFEQFIHVMKNYISDADLAQKIYREIVLEREKQIEGCATP